MSIVTVNKVSLIGLAVEHTVWLEPLQAMGNFHIIESSKPGKSTSVEVAMPERAQEALRYLLEDKQQLTPWELSQADNLNIIIDTILGNKAKKRELEDLRDDYLQFIHVRDDWGDFIFPDLEKLGGFRLWFYIIPTTKLEKMQDCPHAWEVVKQEYGKSYTIVFSQTEPTKLDVPFERTRTGYKSLAQLKSELIEVERSLDVNALERTSMTRWIQVLANHLNAVIDKAELGKATNEFTIDDELCYLQGWVPNEHIDEVKQFCSDRNIACLIEAVADDEAPPTLLKNPEYLSGARQLVQFFQTPGYRTWDPTPVVFVSFNLFFAMILSDAGYALILGVVLLMTRNRLKPQNIGIYRLFQSVVASSLLWGILVGSYFGTAPPETHPLSIFNVVDINNFDAMINLSIAIGVIHLLTALACSARAKASGWLALANVGWMLTFCLASAEYYWEIGLEFIWLGLLMVFVFSSDRPLGSIKNLLLRSLDGLKALTGLSKGFGDVLSYMRLFALGLSSAQLAITFNGIAGSLAAEIPGIGMFLAFLVLLVGHSLNLLLGVMSGVIHGMRLNLIEFLNWGVDAEGYPFKPLAKQEDKRWN